MESLDDRALGQVADYFRAMAEPQRLKILQALRHGPRNVGELTELLACSQANVSKHLALLAKIGLVERSAQGTTVFYRIADSRTYELCDLVCGQIAQRLMDQARGMSAFAAPPASAPRTRGKAASSPPRRLRAAQR